MREEGRRRVGQVTASSIRRDVDSASVKPMTVLLDMDGVLADFERGFAEAWMTRHPEHAVVPPAERTVFTIRESYPPHLTELVTGVYCTPGFFRSLRPIEGALRGVRDLLDAGHDVRICTSPLTNYRHCVPEKYEWVEEHLGADFVWRLILTKDKTLVRGDVLIDDNPDIVGSMAPAWVHAVFEQPYNAGRGDVRMTWATWREGLAVCGRLSASGRT